MDTDQSAILEEYLETIGGDIQTHFEDEHQGEDIAAFMEGIKRTREHILGATDGISACLICLEEIRPNDPIWTCSGELQPRPCFAILHLACIQSWSRQQIDVQRDKMISLSSPSLSEAYSSNATRDMVTDMSEISWECPKCRKGYVNGVPSVSLCFCGKTVNPVFDPWNVPHGCGERCGRNLPCGHECLLLCHPGPCAPCPREVSWSCYCGKSTSSRRCGRRDFSCHEVCGALLSCGHKCGAVCHAGDHPTCKLSSVVMCPCGHEEREVACKDRCLFKCKRVCNKLLNCGVHRCTRICCPKCDLCPSAGKSTCPCGKVILKDVECGTKAPSCGQTCDKLLSCGKHRCIERCHDGPCSSVCRVMVDKKCACGKTMKSVHCSEREPRCDRRCIRQRSCGRHQCRKRCCAGDCPPCPEVCGRRLKCGNHKCSAPCHRYPCPPCPFTVKISCACGKTHFSVPCGREKVARPPKCKHPCPIPATCRHQEKHSTHPCHFGPCPPCMFKCNEMLPCGHRCAAVCHDEPPPAVCEFIPPSPSPGIQQILSSTCQDKDISPSLAVAGKIAEIQSLLTNEMENESGSVKSGSGKMLKTPCPSCNVPVSVSCLGNHGQKELPCYSSNSSFSCGERCNKLLACGNHYCDQTCHDLEKNPCSKCNRLCDRENQCQHGCPQKFCHTGDCKKCNVRVRFPCHCRRSTIEYPCHKVPSLQNEEKSCGKVCLRQLPNCPHLCQAKCHSGPCILQNKCSEQTTIRCKCKRQRIKLPCFQVLKMLQKQKKESSTSYDGTLALKLLDCDEKCLQFNRSTKDCRKRREEDGQGIFQDTAMSRARGTAITNVTKKYERQWNANLNFSRIQRLWGQFSFSKKSKERVVRAIVLFCMTGLAVIFAFGLLKILKILDRQAQHAWRPNNM